ncbi:MAG: hypothetical protein ACXWUG_16695 [Polyangiales bacterium]
MVRPGYEVTTQQSQLSMPALCCACGTRPPTGTVTIQGVANRVRRSMAMPYCAECLATRKKTLLVRFVLLTVLSIVSLVLAAIGAVLPSIPVVILIVGPTIAALVLGILGPKLVQAARLPTPAVQMASFSGNSTTFVCADQTFAERFAAGNGVGVRPRPWSDGLVVGSAFLTTIVGGGMAIYIGLASNPPVHFDNATKKPKKIWVDGKPLLTVEPMSSGKERPDVRIPYGEHEVGWSSPDEDEPRDKEKITVEWGRDHLYNPAQAGCYFLNATAYGSADTKGLENGPLTIRSFYVFKSVDNWFKGNPSSVSSKASGETRVALLPWSSCMELTHQGCPLGTRKKAAECSRKAWKAGDDAGMRSCMVHASDTCGGD